MIITRIKSGKYATEDERFTIKEDWTSAGIKLVKCWTIFDRGYRVLTCKTLADAKKFVKMRY